MKNMKKFKITIDVESSKSLEELFDEIRMGDFDLKANEKISVEERNEI